MTPRLRRYLSRSLLVLALVLAFNLLLTLIFRGSSFGWSGVCMTFGIIVYMRWMFRANPERTT
ncbi:hypothetical protein [Deinococcus ruber]|uniref:Uncharacterized protein n=1 Tax=Deinococcus ruber TaxID=1848197 RepID=A0A918F625_9DEIO|nr:hypothetical protein [Deinococcus ruber]GGR08289.1 hypothetical protein GCM10008957_21260 [Deinococcus ruber]